MKAVQAMGESSLNYDFDELMRSVDKNGDGEVSIEEYLHALEKALLPSDANAELREAFYMYDMNNDGYITKEEFRTTMKSLGENLTEEEVDAMMSQADTNKDGKISMEEFVHLMQ
ncbi:hypothetical protein BLSTO_04712 [Blastocystis sp. subtype 1]